MKAEDTFLPPSKRAALRMIQRACVLTGRERSLRQQIREVNLVTRWRIDDWDLEWTAIVDRGSFHFERRPARRPNVILSWPSAADFFGHREGSSEGLETTLEGTPDARRVAERVLRVFLEMLRRVIEYPYDEDGQRLA